LRGSSSSFLNWGWRRSNLGEPKKHDAF